VLALPSTTYISAAHAYHAGLALPKGIKLRILTLGDSITAGVGGTGGNSYRPELNRLLTEAGAEVTFIGAQKSGQFSHDGYPGANIVQIGQKGMASVGKKPNVITLMAGTNDTPKGDGPKAAAVRLGTVVDNLMKALPDTVVLVSTLTPMFFEAGTGKTPTTEVFNKELPALIKARVDSGKKIALVTLPEMDFAKGGKDTREGIHPNDSGYKKMAVAWAKGIEEAAEKNWIKEPAAV
jgi:lysophospholipase L1-like esterase